MVNVTKKQLDPKQPPDLVFVRDLYLKAVTGVDAWHRPEPQPVSVSIWLKTSVARAGSTDHLTYSLNYAVISRKVGHMVESSRFNSLEDIAERVARVVLSDGIGGQWVRIQVRKPRALLRADASEIELVRQRLDIPSNTAPPLSKSEPPLSRSSSASSLDSFQNFSVVPVEGETDVVRIHKLRLVTIIGVNTVERLHKQNVIIDLTLFKQPLDKQAKKSGSGSSYYAKGKFDKAYDFRAVVSEVSDHVEDSSYKTVEAFVTSVAQMVCKFGVWKVTVRAEKPSALTFADAAGVEITRTRQDFEDSKVEPATKHPVVQDPKHQALFPDSEGSIIPTDGSHVAFIAFGSNLGNTVDNIRTALKEIARRGIKIEDISSLYESEPMFVTDQPKFMNGVIKVSTVLSPIELLDTLQDIEAKTLARIKTVEKGPRTIDLDILLYDSIVMNHPRLVIPHPGMLERSFVLQPLTELVSSEATHPLTAETFRSHLIQIPAPDPSLQLSAELRTIIPLKDSKSLVYDPYKHSVPTQLMAILNITPDSFSDGGVNKSLSEAIQNAHRYVNQGAAIIDIGGVSTRPHSSPVDEATEISRVIPIIKAIRSSSDHKLATIPISIDTYRSTVAREAVKAGADIINDISAGQMDPDMFSTVSELGVPIILNHTRGTPETMNSLADYKLYEVADGVQSDILLEDNTPSAVIQVVGKELLDRVEQATRFGIARWQIILDPGLGFAKNLQHNLAIIKNLHDLRAYPGLENFVWLLGPSRKRFIGTITDVSIASERVIGTAAAVAALVSGGADIIRVHDVREMSQAVKMSDAIYKDILPNN